MGIAKIARRTFLVGAATLAGGLAVGYYYVRKPYDNPLLGELAEGEQGFNPYVKIGADSHITIITPRAEMGQGVHTTLAALVAEELDVELASVNVEHGPGDFAYFNSAIIEEGGPFAFFDESFIAKSVRSTAYPTAKILGLQVTGGSSSTRDAFDKMRRAGGAARQMLLAAAGERWQVDPTGLKTGEGRVFDPGSGKSFSYGELAADAAGLAPPQQIQLKPRDQWKILGKSPPRVDIPAKVTGAALFGIDVDLPDMLYATVVMCPRFGARAVSYDDAAALAVPGVMKVVPLETTTGSGFGILAKHTWAAFMGAEALEVKWQDANYPKDSKGLFQTISQALDAAPDHSLRDDGDVDTAFADAPRGEIITAEYRVPWLAHATMEPMNATAQWKDGVLDIWAPNQAPTIFQMACAPLVGVKPEEVRVHTTMLGGGFGRRGEVDFALYAVEMAKQSQGRPVKVTWTREEDTRHDTYRPAAVARMRARVNVDEGLVALDIHTACPPVIASVLKRTFPSIPAVGPDRTMVEGAFDQPYTIANYRVSGHVVDLPIPVGFWRSVGNSYNGFFHECFMDEIAEKAGIDPLALRLDLMKQYPAATNVLKKVADMAGWGRDLPEGTGLGIAHVLSFGMWTAMVIQASRIDDRIHLDNVWCAADIGIALDPKIIKSQIMSAVIFGLSSAMGQEINFDEGEVVESNFDEFEFMRMYQCPQIEVEVLETYHKMGGAGEPGVPPSLPALANAIYAATGKRIRSMPLSHEVDFA